MPELSTRPAEPEEPGQSARTFSQSATSGSSVLHRLEWVDSDSSRDIIESNVLRLTPPVHES